MISLNSTDNSEKPVKVSVIIGDTEKKNTSAYLYGHSDLIKQNQHKIETNIREAQMGMTISNMIELYITYTDLS